MKLTRRRFLRAALYGTPIVLAANAFGLEPEWIKVRKIRLSGSRPTVRLLHFTDLHFKGDVEYLETVVQQINGLAPDLVCFTGDIIEDSEWLEAGLEVLAKIKFPMVGVPGNHDHWSGVDFAAIRACFEKTGGAWLENQRFDLPSLGINIVGIDRMPASYPPVSGRKNIVLVHYPEWADQLGGFRYNLVLAGHSHGGQVRIPFYGAMVVPFSTGKYEMGLYRTKGGPLYVNPGIGYFYLNVRFNCRPELTVIEV
jgi:predicted MPP superfamily phosphohydrolase